MRYMVGKVIGQFGYALRPTWKIPASNIHPVRVASELLFARQGGKVDTIVQIGVYDGVSGDPMFPKLFEKAHSIVLIEPQPSCVRILKEKYKDDSRFTIMDVALAQNEGEITLWSESSLSQRASIKRQHVEKFGVTASCSFQVKCITPSNLHSMLGGVSPDLLQIDTEGMDWDIVKGLFDAGSAPKVLNFENFHLDKIQRQESRELLTEKGYVFIEHEMDTCAIHPCLLE